MRIDGMNIPYADQVFAMDVRSLVAPGQSGHAG
jgi:hypothetical protein